MAFPQGIKKWQILSIAAFLVLWFLNPSIRQFKEFLGSDTSYEQTHRQLRSANFLVFSLFKDQELDVNGSDIDSEKKYIAFLNNFILIN